MEKLIYLFIPSLIFLKYYLNKKEKLIDIITKYSTINLISNIISFLIFYFIFNIKKLNCTILFSIRYILISIIVNMIMIVIYKVANNYLNFGLEIKYEKNK